MNAKRAKKLRKLIRGLVQKGLPEETTHVINARTKQIRVNPNCARAVYQAYKALVLAAKTR